MKVFQKSLTTRIFTVCLLFGAGIHRSPVRAWAAEPALKAEVFDLSKGFKHSQLNLTEIFLQIAGSLEATGSPELYFRHMQAEQQRISALYQQKTGKVQVSRLPSHMTNDYVNRLIKNWNALSAPLGLEAFAKEIGSSTREGIVGTRLTGTLAVQILNEHQRLVAMRMQGESSKPAGFEELKKQLEHGLEFDREKLDTRGYDTSRRDAVDYAAIIDGLFKKQFRKIDGLAKPEKATAIKEAVKGTFFDLGFLAQTELELGILEEALNHP